jgi:hypothetical protein
MPEQKDNQWFIILDDGNGVFYEAYGQEEAKQIVARCLQEDIAEDDIRVFELGKRRWFSFDMKVENVKLLD